MAPVAVVTVLGVTVADVILQVDTLPINSGSRVLAKDCRVNPGGSSIIAIGCARLGLPTRMVTCLACDHVGFQVKEALIREQVSLDVIAASASTPVIYSLVDGTGAFARVVDLGSLPGKDEYILADMADQVDSILYVEGFACREMPTDFVMRRIEAAKDNGSRLVFDPQPAISEIESEFLELVLGRTDVLCLSEQEAAALLHRMHINTLEEVLHRFTLESVFLKRESLGCDVIAASGRQNFPSLADRVVNTQGAGDAFNAAIIMGLVYRSALEDMAISANAAAALKLRSLDTSLGLPTFSELTSFLASLGLQRDLQPRNDPDQ